MCAKYEWFRADFPEEAKKVRKYVMISSYVLGKLGKVDIEDATIDGSFISWTGMADVASKNWSEEILDELGMESDELSTVVTAIGNHDEGSGIAVNAVAAALTLGIKQTFEALGFVTPIFPSSISMTA